MAIQDRNLVVGSQLWTRYKGEVHTAEVVLNPKANDESGRPIAYRLSDGREFKSPSAAGTAITGKACNGWAFWSVGEPTEPAPKPERTTGSRRAVNAVPKPERTTTRTRRQKDVPRDGNGHALPIVAQVDGTFECANCSASFPTRDEAVAHIGAAHPSQAAVDEQPA
jgi:hypothetical protein